MFHKPIGKCDVITVKNDYYIVNSDRNNYLNIPIFFSIKDPVFIDKKNINSIYLTTEANDEIIPLTIEEINFLKEIKDNNITYYQYDLKVNIDLNIDILTIYDSIYLKIEYNSENNIKLLLGSLCIYNYLQNNDIYYTSLKGIVREYENKKMLQCVAVKLNTNEDIKIVDIISLNNLVSVNMEDSCSIDYINDAETPLEEIILSNYNIIGKNTTKSEINVSNEDYLLIYLKYDKYIEIPCFGFIIKYVIDDVIHEKVVNPFVYYKTNRLDSEIVKITYDANNY